MQRTILFAIIQAKNKEDSTDAINLFHPSEIAVAMLVHPHQCPGAEQAQKPGEELRHVFKGSRNEHPPSLSPSPPLPPATTPAGYLSITGPRLDHPFVFRENIKNSQSFKLFFKR